MANFGKIILFRIEDLISENTDFAYYPAGFGQDGLPPGAQLPFIKQNASIPGFGSYPWTSKKWYRILGKNYKLEDGSLKSLIYDKIGMPGKQYENYIKVRNYFTKFERDFGTLGGAEGIDAEEIDENYPYDKVRFYFLEDIEDYLGNAKDLVEFDSAIKNLGFINHNLSLPKSLMSNQEVNSLDQYGVGDNIKIKPIYNYYLEDYEQFYNSFSERVNFNVNYSEEKSIPNFYYLITLLANPDVFSEVTSNSTTPTPFTIEGILEGIIPSSAGDTTTAPLGQKLANEIMVYEQEAPRERNSIVVVTPSFYKAFSNDISTQKTAHPFYNQIEIPIIKNGTVFRDLFKKAKMYEQLQFRAGLQIRIINKAARFGKTEDEEKSILSSLSSDYNIFYTKAEESQEGLKVSYASPALTPSDTMVVPYEHVSVGTSLKTPEIIEFDVSLSPEGNNYDFKLGGVGNPTYINFKDNYIPRYRYAPVTEGRLDASGVRFNLTKETDDTKAVDGRIVLPLTFYANNPESENDYIASVIQNQANSILKFIFNKAKLHASSVLNNLENYSEILFFEVQKHRAVTRTVQAIYGESTTTKKGQLIQTFILPNDPDIGDKIEYIDSQIKYGEEYIYSIYAHTISIGNEMIRQKNSKTLGAEEFTILTFDYENNYDIKILRVPYHNTGEYGPITTTINIDSPPIPPQVTFFPYKNVSDKIGFWFNIGLGEMKARFATINYPDDLEPLALVFAKGLDFQTDISLEDVLNLPILFKTDDFGGYIEVFRTTERPTAFEDFKDKKIADIDVIGPRTLIDDIVPNQDYYYTFRHRDPHGLYSNPTPVYHLKMITADSKPEQGSVRLGVEGLQPVLFNDLIYLLGPKPEEKVEKSFKKYLLLEPTLSQTYLSFDNFENAGAISEFNTANDVKINKDNLLIGKGGSGSIKGKKFKIRITSKQTGRKIDLNVDFKNLSVIENYKE